MWKIFENFFFSFLRVKNFGEKIFFENKSGAFHYIDHAEHAKNKIRAELVFSAKFFFEIFFFLNTVILGEKSTFWHFDQENGSVDPNMGRVSS